MMLLRIQSILYFNVKRTIWLKGYRNGKRTEPSEQRLQEISIVKNWPRAGFEPVTFGFQSTLNVEAHHFVDHILS